MEPFSAAFVYETWRSFEQLRSTCNLIERFGKVKFSGTEIAPSEMEHIELRSTRTRTDFPEDWRKSVESILTSVEKYCESIGLKLASQAAGEFLGEIRAGTITTYSDASEAIGTLEKIIKLQLRENLFVFISPERAAFYAKPQLFGESVNKRLPACQYDIEESGNCYAAGRGTACAFHLMRVMELAVRELGTALGISLTSEKNWQEILDQLNKAIKSLPQKDPRTVALSQAAAYLYNVKVAWRNPTMHPKITYTVEEAGDLISAVKAFMNELIQAI
ncbi:MAG: hypothetical protein WCE50_19250 [Candidatus Acidiferrum sp.]